MHFSLAVVAYLTELSDLAVVGGSALTIHLAGTSSSSYDQLLVVSETIASITSDR